MKDLSVKQLFTNKKFYQNVARLASPLPLFLKHVQLNSPYMLQSVK